MIPTADKGLLPTLLAGSLVPGDVVLYGNLFPTLDPEESLAWTLASKYHTNQGTTIYIFEVTWAGVYVATFEICLNKEGTDYTLTETNDAA